MNLKSKLNNFFKIIKTKKTNIYKQKHTKLNIENPKKISVVIPNYNYEDYIIERIDSVVMQTYPIYELIIIDDCSKDNSINVIETKVEQLKKTNPNLKITFVKNKQNSGNVFCGWQKAFELSTGDFLWIAEADDSCDLTFLETIIKGFDDSQTILSYCESLTMDEHNKIIMENLREWIDIFNCGKWDKSYTASGIEELSTTLCINNTIANVSSVVFRKLNNINYSELLKTSQSFKLAGDWYFYSKILEYGNIAYFSSSLNYHRMQQRSITLTTSGAKEYEEICKIQDDIMSRINLTEDVKSKVLQRREDTRIRLGVDKK